MILTNRYLVSTLFAVFFVTILLSACGSGGLEQVACRLFVEENDQASLWDRVKCYLAEIPWTIETFPVVGAMMTWVLTQIPPQYHWVVGVTIVVMVLAVLGGGASAYDAKSAGVEGEAL